MTDRTDRELVESGVAEWACDECGAGYASETAAEWCCGTGVSCLMESED